MTADLLQQIQTLQFSQRGEAEDLLRSFIGATFSLDVEKVELRPQAVSLNSFNGFLTLRDGKRLFFKTHTEQDNVIGEYYNAKMLGDAGYPVIQPIYSSTKAGQHLLIYEVIHDPSVFDVAWQIESKPDDNLLDSLTAAQHAADDLLLQLYLGTLAQQSASEAAQAPVHQLFYHRLVGGRLDRFYGADTFVMLPDEQFSMQQVRRAKWTINGQQYADTIDNIIERSMRLLTPAQAGPAVVGHGDAHNGNVFFRQDDVRPSLLYFDPAFAGRHDPLLDLTKPLFHNVFAMWMYFPNEKLAQTHIHLIRKDNLWQVEYDYDLPTVRLMFFRSKVERVLIPVLRELKRRSWLREDWRSYLKAALFCCPLLTLNLADSERFPPQISLLGLAMAVEMGAESREKRSIIDRTLDEVEQAL